MIEIEILRLIFEEEERRLEYINLYEVYQTKNNLYLVFNLIQGGNLN